MISMLSQLSSAQDKAAPFRYEARPARKAGPLAELATLGGSIALALFLVNGIHGLTQAFGVA